MSLSNSRLSFTICSSSSIRGRLFTNAADFSRPTAVLLNVWMKRPISGFAHTLAASIRPTVLPDSVPPQRCTKNGRPPSGFTSTDANADARITRANTLFCRMPRAMPSHFSMLPRFFTLSKKVRKFASPSNTSSST